MLVGIGNKYLYTDTKKEESIPYLTKALTISYESKDSTTIGYALKNISAAYATLSHRDSALYYAKQALEYSRYESTELLYATTLYEIDSVQESKTVFEDILKTTNSPNILYSCYSYLNKISIKEEDMKSLDLNIDSVLFYMDSMYENAMQLRNDYYESTLPKEKDNIALIKKAKKKDICIIIVISVGLLAISIITLLYIQQEGVKTQDAT